MNRITTGLPGLDADRVATAARDAAYITVGFGVLAFQRAQVRRRELAASVKERADELGTGYERFEANVDRLVAEVSRQLPAPAAAVVQGVHRTNRAARHQVASLLRVA